MRRQGILLHELTSDLTGQRLVEAALDVDGSQFLKLEFGIFAQFLALAGHIGLLGIGLLADRDVLTSSHRHGAGRQARDACD